MNQPPDAPVDAHRTTRARPSRGAPLGHQIRGNYDLVVAVFCGLLLISNVGATKAIAFGSDLPLIGSVITDGGAFLFPLTYVLGDVLAEVYGLRRARRAIVIGFALAALASLTFLVVGITPPAPDWANQAAWQAVLGFFPQIVVASLCGYLAGQFLNAYVLVKIKERTGNRSLWARLIGSTLVGELADTVLFCTIAYAGTLTSPNLVNYIVTGYVYKVTVEIVCLPITYRVIKAVQRREPAYAESADRRTRMCGPHATPSERTDTSCGNSGSWSRSTTTIRPCASTGMRSGSPSRRRTRVPGALGWRSSAPAGPPWSCPTGARSTSSTPSRPAGTGVSEQYRVAVEVDDADAVTDRLVAAGAELVAPPTPTPWNSRNARLRGPAGVQLTVFTELEVEGR